ncbi:hypothetical protein NFI96_028891, partial [Prochilodus magdalenae]
SHSLHYLYTAVTPGIDFPEFSVVGLVDGEQFVYYDSNTRRMIPRTGWMERNEDGEYWNSETQISQGHEESFKVNVATAMHRFNQTTGVHTLQWMYGCELRDDGSRREYFQYGYDGEDFISLELNTLTWTAANARAVITKHKWDRESWGRQVKTYLENTCTEWLQKYVGYGRSTLERRVPPEVDLFQRDSSSPVVCHATGFFPKAVMISWMKNGEDVHENVELRETTPNQDGTFQKRSILTVSPEELDKHDYTCIIQHSSLENGITLQVFNRRDLSALVNQPGTQYPGTQYPGTQYPGTHYPGTRYPGTRYPGTRYPGTRYPGTRYPGTHYPGTRYPGTRYPGTRYPGTRCSFFDLYVVFSLRYLYTAVTPGMNIPEFSLVGLLDAEQIYYYDSLIRRMIPKTEWIKKNEGEEYWNSETQISQRHQENLRTSVANIMQRFNQTEGLMDRGLMDGGLMDGGLMDRGLMDGGLMDRGLMDRGLMDGGLMDRGLMDGGLMDRGLMDRGLMDRGLMDRGLMDGGLMDGGLMDGGLMDRGLMDGGLMDRGLMDGGLMDRGLMDRGLMDGGLMDGGLMDRGLMDRGLMDRELMDRGLMDRGLMDRELMDRGLMDRGLMDIELMDRGLMDRGLMDRGLMDRELMDRGLMDRGLMDRGLMDRGLMDRGLMDRGLMDGGLMDRGLMDRGLMDRELMDRGLMDRELMDRGLMDRGLMDRELMDRGLMDRGLMDRGLMDRGLMDGGLMDGGLMDGGLMDRGLMDRELMDRGLMDRGLMDRGLMDGGLMDGGLMDRGLMDGGLMDRGLMDGGLMDGGLMDGGLMDGGLMDRGLMDRGLMNRGLMDRGLMDRGLMDRELMDRGLMDRGLMDGGLMDRGLMDRGLMDGGLMDGGLRAGGHQACQPVVSPAQSSVNSSRLYVLFMLTATHSLQYFYTAVTPGINFPEFSVVGLVDGQQVVYYDSYLRKMIPKTEWMEKNDGEGYWNSETQISQRHQENFKDNVATAMQRFNQTTGVHTVQWMYGCELDEGTKRGYSQYGYDGEDFLSLDLYTLTWTAANPKAVITKQKWEGESWGGQVKTYLETTCTEWLEKYVDYGRATLERRVRPEVTLFRKDSSSLVVCHATGFFPKPLMISWKKNGEDLYEDDMELIETVPNQDGTFQKRSILTVSPEELDRNNYTCIVQHSSLEKEMMLQVSDCRDLSEPPDESLLTKVVFSPVDYDCTGLDFIQVHLEEGSLIQRTMKCLLLLTLTLHLAAAVPHSLQYFYTAVSPGTDFPEFSVVGLLDGDQVVYYDSYTRRMNPKTEWMENNEGEEYWDSETQISQRHQENFRTSMADLVQRFNQTGGVHTLQWTYGCELRDYGSRREYFQYGYDGEDFISLDLDTETWTAANARAVTTKLKWEGEAWAAQVKTYLENTCESWLWKHVDYYRFTVEIRVDLFQRNSSSPVVCHATGFHLKPIIISWQKNGEDLHENVELRETLPNQDGTFQKRSILTAPPEELDRNYYTCVIQFTRMYRVYREYRVYINHMDEMEYIWENLYLHVSERRVLQDGGSGLYRIIFIAVAAALLLFSLGMMDWTPGHVRPTRRRHIRLDTGLCQTNTASTHMTGHRPTSDQHGVDTYDWTQAHLRPTRRRHIRLDTGPRQTNMASTHTTGHRPTSDQHGVDTYDWTLAHVRPTWRPHIRLDTGPRQTNMASTHTTGHRPTSDQHGVDTYDWTLARVRPTRRRHLQLDTWPRQTNTASASTTGHQATSDQTRRQHLGLDTGPRQTNTASASRPGHRDTSDQHGSGMYNWPVSDQHSGFTLGAPPSVKSLNPVDQSVNQFQQVNQLNSLIQRTMKCLLLLTLTLHLAAAGSPVIGVSVMNVCAVPLLTVPHSLQYLYTAISPGTDFPEFSVVGLLDGDQVVYYDSYTRRMIPKTEWMENNEGEEYWDSETQISQRHQENFRTSMADLVQRFNQTEGVHTLQWMYGCELRDYGSRREYFQYGYDGEDFISLDLDTGTWTAANARAVITKHKWEGEAWAAQVKNYLRNTCESWLWKHVDYYRFTVERKGFPKVDLFQRNSSSPVVCHATGFFPRPIIISWKKNGEDLHENVELRETLPNQDGTFQKRSILTVSPEELDRNYYTCVIQFSRMYRMYREYREYRVYVDHVDEMEYIRENLYIHVSERRVLQDGSSGLYRIIFIAVAAALLLFSLGMMVKKCGKETLESSAEISLHGDALRE